MQLGERHCFKHCPKVNSSKKMKKIEQIINAILFDQFAGTESIAELLIEHGANISFADRSLKTPLHLAAQYGFYSTKFRFR